MSTHLHLVNAPPPHLRIVPTNRLYPHEEHDSQRLIPLIERLRRESVMINPPIVAPMNADETDYVVLDGANRTTAFAELGFPHVLVQIARYESPFVQLQTWHHVVCAWDFEPFAAHVREIPQITMTHEAHSSTPLATLRTRDSGEWHIETTAIDPGSRNHALVRFVSVYQRHAVLHRTTLNDPEKVWATYDDGIILITFPPYHPTDVITAARERAFIPPGITRHIIQGRALRVNYPLDLLSDPETTLDAKNRQLDRWFHHKIDARQMRYYAESTYQFDE